MGSNRGSEVFMIFPDAVRRMDVFAVFVEALGGGTGEGGVADGQNMLVVVMAAITPRTTSAITSFRFSTPSFT